MGIPPLISDLALILVSAGITTILFKWLKQPVVLGYIVAGCLVSSQVSLVPSVSGVSDLGTWSDIGVVFLLFSLGLDFSFKKLMNVGRTAIISALVIVTFMIILGFFVGMALGWGMTNSVLLGGMISMSSTAIIIKAFEDMQLRSQKFTKIVFGILIFEDLIAIVLMVLISTLFVGKSFEGYDLIYAILKLVFFLAVWMIGGIFFVPNVLSKVKKVLNSETLLVFSLGLCFAMVLFAMKVGFSSALGAFVMGSVLAETLEAEKIEELVRPLKDLFGAIFFVSVGMMVDFNIIVEYALPIALLVLTVVLGQIVFSSVGILLAGQPLKVAIQSGFSLTQIGEFAFIIAMLGVNLKIIDEFIYPVIVAVSVITIFLTPYVMRMSDPVYNFIVKKLPERLRKQLEHRTEWKSTPKSENMWHSLLLQILHIVLICGVMTVAVEMISVYYLLPYVMEILPNIWGKILVAFVTILCVSPLLRAMVAKKNHSREYKYLWAQKKSNHVPLVMLIVIRFILAFVIISFLLMKVFNVHVGIIALCAGVLIFLMLMSKRVKLFSINMERKFKENLNSREYEENRKTVRESGYRQIVAAQLSSYEIHLVDFVISPMSLCVGKTLKELDYRRRFDVHIVSILRGARRYNIPGGGERLYPMDKILVLGTDENLERFQQEVKQEEEKTFANNRRVTIEQIQIDKRTLLVGKTLAESGIRESKRLMVVGVERDGCPIMNPDAKFKFEEGDIVWVVGESGALHKMLDEKQKESVRVLEEC